MRKFALVVGLCLASGAWAQEKSKAPAQVQTSGGRWQVVNPTPEMARNIMLLDSQTGETYVMCIDADGASGWCLMQRSRAPATPPKERQSVAPDYESERRVAEEAQAAYRAAHPTKPRRVLTNEEAAAEGLLSKEDQRAVDWARAHMEDPRAVEILKANGLTR